MPSLVTQKQLQTTQKLPFCYACGNRFLTGEQRNQDHVPPKACFSIRDRASPLKLPTHFDCNALYKVDDERVGQFISTIDKRPPASDKLRIKTYVRPLRNTGIAEQSLINVNIYGAIERWVRAFHAALYREPAPPETRFGIQTPFHVAVPSQNGPVRDKYRPQHLYFVELVKSNRTAGNIDRIASNNGKLRYECVWTSTTKGIWVCVFALDIHGWRYRATIHNYEPRGCTGFYQLPLGTAPALGTKAISLKIELPNYDKLDPFGR